NACFGTGIVLFLARSGATNTSDNFITYSYRDTSTESQYVGNIPLRRIWAFARALLKFQGRRPEHASRVCLSPSHLGLLRSRFLTSKTTHDRTGRTAARHCRVEPF